MNSTPLLFIMEYVLIAVLLFALIFTLGVVWRTEKQLDHAYKFFCLGLLAFLGSRVLGLGVWQQVPDPFFWTKAFELSAAAFFLLSVLEMRDIVRRLDHEKKLR